MTVNSFFFILRKQQLQQHKKKKNLSQLGKQARKSKNNRALQSWEGGMNGGGNARVSRK